MGTRRLGGMLLATTLVTAAAPAGELQDDLRARREAVSAALGPETLFIQFSAPARVYSNDVTYEYRQDSDLLYLTGIDQEGTILVMLPGNRVMREFLFVRDPDPRHEHWSGHLLTKEEAREASGVEEVRLVSEFHAFLKGLMNRRPAGKRWNVDPGEYAAFFDALGDGRARLAVVFGPRPGPDEDLPPVFRFAEKMRQRLVGATLVDATDVVWGLRQVKTPYEQDVMRRSGKVSSNAHRAAMRATRPGRYEYEVEAELEKVYVESGARGWSYPSIVGSGPNATILHYERSDRRMEDGDVLLIDAAANYEGLTVDITRTWPVNGRFSPEQADLWKLVLGAQEAGKEAAVPGALTTAVEEATAVVVRKGLLELGLVTDADSEQFRTWYTHGVCHWIGMDVHDVGDYRRPLEPGMTFVIEPGIYIRESALDLLPDTPENQAFVEAVRPAVQRYRDTGVRVEDSFLLTAEGLETLSETVPRTVEEIESFMAGQ
ncbi:MAG: aminopeptidase P N-terminal domain-containing protein [Acidobacteria bacterium]|nr:aminopeptidase P N-terminal domain-containing protein [Acidobacteriota bacterium]